MADEGRAGREGVVDVAKPAQPSKVLGHRVLRELERRAGSDRRRADALFGPPLRNLRREQILPCGLVPTPTEHAHLVPVVDRGSPSQGVEKAVAEQIAREELRALATALLLDLERRSADVVVPEEGDGCRRDAVREPEVVVVAQASRDAACAGRAAGVAHERVLQREVDDVRHAAFAHERRQRRSVGLEDLAEDVEGRDAGSAGSGADLRHPRLEERAVDVLRGVDAEAVDLVGPNPVTPDACEAVDHERLLGEDVVEAEEVSLLEAARRAGREVDVAAIVVPRHVVQPCRSLERPLLREHDRLARLVAGGEARKPLASRIALRRVRLALAVAVRRLLRRAVARPTGEQDDVRRMVDDDVEVDLQPEAVRAVDEGREVGIRPEVRVDPREVEPPVAVVGGAVALHRLLDDDGREPDGGEAEILHAREPRSRVVTHTGQPLQVAAVVPADVRGVVARHRPAAARSPAVVRRVAVRVAVGHHEVDALVRERRVGRWLRERIALGAARRCDRT